MLIQRATSGMEWARISREYFSEQVLIRRRLNSPCVHGETIRKSGKIAGWNG